MAELPAFATVSDLSDWLGEPIAEGTDDKRAQIALRMASMAVRSETRRTWLKPDITPPELVDNVPEVVWTVTLLAASRAYETPEALTFTRFSDRIDDGQIDRSVNEVGFGLYPSEKAMLAKLVGSGSSTGVGVIHTTRGPVPPIADDLAWWVNGPDLPPDMTDLP
jgi:hypothetical protein